MKSSRFLFSELEILVLRYLCGLTCSAQSALVQSSPGRTKPSHGAAAEKRRRKREKVKRREKTKDPWKTGPMMHPRSRPRIQRNHRQSWGKQNPLASRPNPWTLVGRPAQGDLSRRKSDFAGWDYFACLFSLEKVMIVIMKLESS